ncbi:ras-related protein Rab-32B-like [Macrobrachium nipponense]|uniref:ras-related protein Rab-32B-like n=1 Tax=Macrobrachium nipponense TaxID=159736 RepID=UPI0030C8071C
MTRVYYKYAVAAIVVFDLSRPPTFEAVLKWVSDIREKVTLNDGRPLPVLLLANKCDIESISIQPEVIKNFCKQHLIDAWFLTSAKEDINIEDAMKWLVGRILEVRSTSQAPRPLSEPLPQKSLQKSQHHFVADEGYGKKLLCW